MIDQIEKDKQRYRMLILVYIYVVLIACSCLCSVVTSGSAWGILCGAKDWNWVSHMGKASTLIFTISLDQTPGIIWRKKSDNYILGLLEIQKYLVDNSNLK